MNTFLNKNNNQKSELKDEIIINNLKCPICNKICLIEINEEKLSITFKCNNNCNYINIFQNNIISGKSLQKDNSYLNKNEKFCIHHEKLNYHTYCFKCKKNICKKCLKAHEQHQKVDLKLLKPHDNEIFLNKMKVREKYEKFSKIMKDIIKWKKEFDDGFNSYINAINNIFNIENFIVTNYDNLNSNNYNYIQNYNYIKNLDINISELENIEKNNDWKEKGQILMDIIIKNKKIIYENDILKVINNINSNRNNNNTRYLTNRNNNKNNLRYSANNNNNERNLGNRNNNKFRSHSRKVQKLIDLGQTINNENLTIELNKNIENNKISLNLERQYIKMIQYKNRNNEGEEFEEQDAEKNNNLINSNEIKKALNIRNIDNNTYESRETNKIQNDNIDIINNENIKTQNDDLLNNGRIENMTNDNKSNKEIKYNNLELKSSLRKNKLIKSIEFIQDNKILICTPDSLNIYKIDTNFSFVIIYSRNFTDDIINYGTQLSNGNIIICFSKTIKIMRINEKEQLNNNCIIIQELKPNYNNFNFNKIIEIKKKNYLISCSKNYITLYKKNKEKNSYDEIGKIKIEEEIKCIENINEKIFVSVNPEKQIITFYDIEDFNDNKLIIENIQTSYGRYIAKNVQKYDTLFIAGIYGIYLISTKKYELYSFYLICEWISSIDFDYSNNSIICGSYKNLNNNKSYNLIIYSTEIENIKEKHSSKINIIEEIRKNKSHQSEIMIAKISQNEYIITGSNDKNIKIWN